MDNAVLTGTATAVSSIGYYGSYVTVSVITDFSSTVTRLSPSKRDFLARKLVRTHQLLMYNARKHQLNNLAD